MSDLLTKLLILALGASVYAIGGWFVWLGFALAYVIAYALVVEFMKRRIPA